jgi:hypothetical protein
MAVFLRAIVNIDPTDADKSVNGLDNFLELGTFYNAHDLVSKTHSHLKIRRAPLRGNSIPPRPSYPADFWGKSLPTCINLQYLPGYHPHWKQVQAL